MSAHILIEHCVGETRAAAFDESGRPFSLFLDRWFERGSRALFGEAYSAKLTRIAAQQGGGYAELESGEQVFLRGKQLHGLAEGVSIYLKIASEARLGKLARGTIIDGIEENVSALERWRSDLKLPAGLEIEERLPGDHEISSAFEEALQTRITLHGGGAMTLSETPALIAIDIDTAGRMDAGRAADRALKINSSAAKAVARQLCLRDFGGLVVLDCVAPLARSDGENVRKTFLESFRGLSGRRVQVLKPSPFGLMEISLAWQRRPAAHALLDNHGRETAMTAFQNTLRRLERELISHRTKAFCLSVPSGAERSLPIFVEQYREELTARYGARISVEVSATNSWDAKML